MIYIMAKVIRTYEQKRIKRMCFMYGDGRVAQQVKDAVGCDDIFNASFYGSYETEDGSATYKWPVFHLKTEGSVKKDPGYQTYGLSWMTPSADQPLNFGVKLVQNEEDNWISGYILLSPEHDMNAPIDREIPSFSTKRGRTLVGVKENGDIVIYCSKDDYGADALNATQCRLKMHDLGCQYAIMLDGGGSSQCDCDTGEYIRSSRAVCDYLCIWLYTDEELEAMEKPEEPAKILFYRVQVGAFSKKQNAINYQATMAAAGYPDSIVQTVNSGEQTLYKVQLGAFTNKDNATRLRDELKSKGFNAFIQEFWK